MTEYLCSVSGNNRISETFNCPLGCSTETGACVQAGQTCTAKWQCKNPTTRYYQNANCSFSQETNCPNGCLNGTCAELPAPANQNYTLEDFDSYTNFEETEVSTGKGAVFSFSVQRAATLAEKHTITVKSINSAARTVVLTVSSTPFNVNFSAIGQRNQIDANKDGFYDIAVTLEGFADGDAILSFKKLAACGNGICETSENSATCCKDCNCSAGQKCEQNKCATPAPSFSRIAVFVIVPIVIVAIIIASFFIMRHLIRNAEQKGSRVRKKKRR
jgi:hypothetical protein